MLVDCLTLWLTNLMVAGREVEAECARLLDALPGLRGRSCWSRTRSARASCRTDAMARAFVDHAGWLHQRIAEQADAVVFMTAGLPHRLK